MFSIYCVLLGKSARTPAPRASSLYIECVLLGSQPGHQHPARLFCASTTAEIMASCDSRRCTAPRESKPCDPPPPTPTAPPPPPTDFNLASEAWRVRKAIPPRASIVRTLPSQRSAPREHEFLKVSAIVHLPYIVTIPYLVTMRSTYENMCLPSESSAPSASAPTPPPPPRAFPTEVCPKQTSVSRDSTPGSSRLLTSSCHKFATQVLKSQCLSIFNV